MVTLFDWFIQNPLAAAVVVFGGAAIVVILYTYIVDYLMVVNGG